MNGKRFYIKKGRIGCLLVHGLTSSTQELEYLANYLSSKGYTILAPLLEGHNSEVKQLAKNDWYDWYRSVETDFEFLSKKM